MFHLKSNFEFSRRIFFSIKDVSWLQSYLHVFSLDIPIAGQSFCEMFGPSVNVSQAWWMISFWVATLFWVSSLHAQPVLPVLTRIPPELKGDPSRVPLFHGRTPYICEWPATHGLGANNSPSPWLSTHAALVSFKNQWPTEHTEHTDNTENSAHELIELKEEPRTRAHNTDKHGQLFNSPSYLRCLKCHKKDPKPAQGRYHTLSLAPLGFRLIVQSNIYGRFGTGDIFRKSPVPQRLYFFYAFILKPKLITPTVGASWMICNTLQNPSWSNDYPQRLPAVFSPFIAAAKTNKGELIMIKNYRMVIDLSINISEQISPELIRKAKENTIGDTVVYLQQGYLDMLQHIINYISTREDLFNECVYGHLLFKLMSYNSDEDLEDTLDFEPDLFENNLLLAAEAMGPEYATFVRQLYQYQSDEDDESNAAPVQESNIIILAEAGANAKKEEIPYEEREVLIELLHLCLLDSTILSSSLAPVTGEILKHTGE